MRTRDWRARKCHIRMLASLRSVPNTSSSPSKTSSSPRGFNCYLKQEEEASEDSGLEGEVVGDDEVLEGEDEVLGEWAYGAGSATSVKWHVSLGLQPETESSVPSLLNPDPGP